MLSRETVVQSIVGLVITLSIVVTFAIVLLVSSKEHIFSFAVKQADKEATENIAPFPVSVNPETKIITENHAVDTFFADTLAVAPSSKQNWWNQIAAIFASQDWYQNLASPVGRIVVIWPGDRKEEATKKIGDILRWDTAERGEFQSLMDETEPALSEGKYYPGQYVAHRHATPEEMQQLIHSSFETEILYRYTPDVAAQVPLQDALIIASLLEREASDFENMREISGVIWNRLFINMPLQLDATLQYVRGSNPYEPHWWPAVLPDDKYSKSLYNTYQHEGLPPAPIANPSAEAVLAALNPINTDCLFYFHTKNGAYHCSETYEGHVSKLRSIYGRGR